GFAVGGGRGEVLDAHPDPGCGGVGHVGGDEAGGDRVDVDAVGTELDAEGAGEALDALLGGGGVGLAPVAEGAHSREVDDLPVLLGDEDLLGRTAHQERAAQVHVHHRVPVVVGHLG